MKSMILYKSGWTVGSDFIPTIKMLPTTTDCPFNEVLFDPENKVLAIVGKEKKQSYRFIPKLDDAGKATQAQERKLMENFYEYYLESKEDIYNFINMFALNSDTFDWKKFIEESKK